MNTVPITRPGRELSPSGFIINKQVWRFIMYICTFRYTPEDVDCRYCLEYAHRRCTAQGGCPYIAERIEAAAIGYGEAVQAAFQRPSAILRWRLRHLTEHFGDSLWENENHAKRFERMRAEMGTRKKRDTPQFFAALYLLTANEDIWRRCYNCFSTAGIETGYARMTGISIRNYALVQAAKSIYLGTDHFLLSDLEDNDAVDAEAFRLIVNAILIARYGMEALKLKGEREESV